VLRSVPSFFKFLNTPLLRCKGLGRVKEELEFDSSEAFIAWKRSFEAREQKAVEDCYAIKYYKGLATLESADVRRVFSQLDRRLVTLLLDAETHAIMLRYFDKDQEDARKDALCELADRLNRGETTPASSSSVRFDTYMYWDVGAFFLSDVIRSVFMYVDGLKPSQRKFLFALLSKRVKHGRDYAMNGVRVAQMAAAVAESMHYHHGEVSMQETIVRMAQNIVGVNNVPFVEGLGGFGNRMDAPKETHGQPRYIFVKHGQLLEALFPKADMPVLPVLLEEGDEAEAVHLVPPVPLLLFNGGGGIGTGWSTNVLPRHPVQVCETTRDMICDMRSKHPKLGYAGGQEDIIASTLSVDPIDWSSITPDSLGVFDSQEPASDWERIADGLEPYFEGF
jgi:DNA topoisomerase-2